MIVGFILMVITFFQTCDLSNFFDNIYKDWTIFCNQLLLQLQFSINITEISQKNYTHIEVVQLQFFLFFFFFFTFSFSAKFTKDNTNIVLSTPPTVFHPVTWNITDWLQIYWSFLLLLLIFLGECFKMCIQSWVNMAILCVLINSEIL